MKAIHLRGQDIDPCALQAGFGRRPAVQPEPGMGDEIQTLGVAARGGPVDRIESEHETGEQGTKSGRPGTAQVGAVVEHPASKSPRISDI